MIFLIYILIFVQFFRYIANKEYQEFLETKKRLQEHEEIEIYKLTDV